MKLIVNLFIINTVLFVSAVILLFSNQAWTNLLLLLSTLLNYVNLFVIRNKNMQQKEHVEK